MTLLYVDGFDAQDYALRWNGVTSSWVSDSASPYGAGSCLRGNRGTSVIITRPVTASAQIFVGFAVAMTTMSAIHNVITFYTDNAATQHITVSVLTTGAVQVQRGATVIATSAAGVILTTGAWQYLEVSVTIDDTVGNVTVKLNGSTIINFTGDTRNAGTSTNIDTIGIYNPGGTTTTAESTYFDDLYVCNALGSTNNTFLGPTRVQTLLPNGAGSSTQFTPVSGANYTNVNDVPDNTATYVSDTVTGHRDTYTIDDLTPGSSTIYGVQQCMHARQLVSGTATIKQAQKSGATVSYGATKNLGPSNQLCTDIFETNPATSAAYTQSDVNALEIGAEVA